MQRGQGKEKKKDNEEKKESKINGRQVEKKKKHSK